MEIDQEALAKVAHLARLQIKPEEEATMLKSMISVLSWMEQLNEIDTEGVEPLTHITDEANNWREDKSDNTLTRAQALTTAPSQDGIYIRVPKVIE